MSIDPHPTALGLSRSRLTLLFAWGAATFLEVELWSRRLERQAGSAPAAAIAGAVALWGALAVGALWAGRRVDAAPRPARLFALCEAALALVAALAPSLPASPALTLLLLAMAGALAGAAFIVALSPAPAVAKPVPVAALAAALMGAAVAALASGYLLVATLGVRGTLAVAAAMHLVLAAFALVAEQRAAATPAAAEAVTTAPPHGRWELAFAAGAGLVAFAFVAICSRLLGLVVGGSVYAVGLGHCVLLAGVAGGSAVVARRRPTHPLALAVAQSLVGFAILTVAPMWDRLPLWFVRAGAWSPSFVLWEGTRLAATLVVVLPPAVAVGATFALVLGAAAPTSRCVAERGGATLLGAIAGWLVGRLVLPPLIGSQGALLLVAVAAIGQALFALARAAAPKRIRLAVGGAWAITLSLLLGLGSPWNATTMSSGAQLHFSAGLDRGDRLLLVDEDGAGDTIAVVERDGRRTLLVDGIPSGDDRVGAANDEIAALVPMLFVSQPRAALAVGVGAANQLAALGAFPFATLDLVERSPAEVEAARHAFAEVNGGILDDPRVTLHLEEARPFLRRRARRYDLIALRPRALAVDDGAYARELYAAAERQLEPDGVLAQTLPLDHLAGDDLATVLATAGAVFAHVSVWMVGPDALLVATRGEQRADARRLQRWSDAPALRRVLAQTRLQHPYAAFGHLLLDEHGVAAFVDEARLRGDPVDPAHSDDRPRLAYSTPKSNLRGSVQAETMERLRRHAAPSLLAHVSGLADDAQTRLFLAYAARERGFVQLARLLMSPVRDRFLDGPDAPLLRLLDAMRGAPWP